MARTDSSRETVGTNLSGSPQASNTQSSQVEERDEAKFSRPPAPSTFAPSATAACSSTSSFSSSPPHSKAPSSGRCAAGMETNKGETWYGTETSASLESAKDKGQISADDSLVSSRDVPEKMNPSDEKQRLLALRSLGVTKGASQDQRFGAITRSVRSLFRVPVSGLSLSENEVVYMHSRGGDFVCSAPPKGSFCDWTLEPEDPQILIVEDAAKDPRFADHPFVKDSPYIRFYAGYPLVGQDGKRYGTICIIDFECRSFAPEEYSILRNFADIAARELERDLMHRSACVRLEEQLKLTENRSKRVLRAFDASQEPIALMDVTHPEWPIVYANPAWGRAVDVEQSTMQLCRSEFGLIPSPWAPFWHMFAKHSFDADETGAAFAAVQSGASFSLTVRGVDNKQKVTLLQFKPVREGGSLGENDMPEVPFSAGITNNRGPLKKFSGAPPMTREQNAAVAAALAALSGATTLSLNERSEPERECTEQPSVANRVDAVENPATEDAHDQASPVYYLGMVLHMETRYSNEQSSTPLSPGSSYHEALSCFSVDHHDEEPPTTRHWHGDKDNGTSDGRIPAKGHDIRDSTPQLPKNLEGDLKLGALIGCPAHPRCFQGSWHGSSVAVKVRSVAHIHPSTRENPSESEKPTVSGSKMEMVKLSNDGSGGSRSRSSRWNERRQLVVPTLAHPSLLPVYAVHACVRSLHGSDGSSCEDATEGKVPIGTIELWEIQKLADLGSLASNMDAGTFKAGDGSDRVDLKVVLATAYDIACGMSYLHRAANRVHGCLTSSNVFLVSDASDERGWKAMVSEYLRMERCDLIDVLLEDLVLTDACCPTYPHDTSEEYDDHRFARAAEYLPPEVLGGRPVDRSTDVYSFGMVLWEMIEGRRAMPRRVDSGEVVPMGMHDENHVPDVGSPSSWPMSPLHDVIRDCVHVDCRQRPSFKDLIPRLKELQRRMGTERN